METTPFVQVFVGIGSNLGDRARHLAMAVEALARLPRTRVERLSSVYRTRPWGVRDQPCFYNLVAELATGLAPQELLQEALAIEARLGRVRAARWGPRTVDIDLLLYDELTLQTPELVLPHPRMLERAFVLVPLAELAPDRLVAGHPVREHLAALGDVRGEVRRLRRRLPLPAGPTAGGAAPPARGG